MPNGATVETQGLTDEDTPIDPLTCPAGIRIVSRILNTQNVGW